MEDQRYAAPIMVSSLGTNGSTSAWSKLRAAAKYRLEEAGALPCWRCGRLVQSSERWVLGHVVDRALGGDDSQLAIEHQLCSLKSGGELHTALLRARLDVHVTGEPGELFPGGQVLGY